MLWIGPQEPEKRSVRELARLVALALSLAWRAGRRELTLALSLQLVQAVGLVGLLLLGREVVDKMRKRVIALEGGKLARDERRGGYTSE